ncbi:hypothetical protein Tco_1207491 [Tanacetum coccineum]
MADDEPMWGNNRAVAPTPGVAIITVDLGDNFTVKGHHLSMIKDRQFDGCSQADPHKHMAEFIDVCGRNETSFSESKEHSPLLAKMEALTKRIDSQFKEIKGDMKEMRDGCNKCRGPHRSSDFDDKPMGGPKEEEANFASG